jgi:hypothetical protein
MTSTKLENIIQELGQYFGVRSRTVLESNDGDLKFENFNLKFADNANFEEFFKIVMSKSQSSPSIGAILERLENDEERINFPLLITPPNKDNINLETPGFPLNMKNKSKTDQGTEADERNSFYTTNELFDLEDNQKKPITVFQNFAPASSASTIDTDLIDLYMKVATSLEMSRAVPYLEVGIAGAVATNENKEVNREKNYTFLGRFLGSKPGDLNFFNAETDPDRKNPRFDPIDALEKDGKTLTIIGGMDSFTAPQTMVNADNNYENSKGQVIDQFLPFMSLLSLRLSVVGQGGLMSFKSGNLELMLHDRSKLNTIGSLISPDSFGNTRLIITYGWSHPDGTLFDRPSNLETEKRLVGKLIDSMKVTETYLISNSKFSFEEMGVKISLSISMVGGKTLTETDVSIALGDDLENTIEDAKEQLANLNKLLNEFNRSRQSNNMSTISTPRILSNPEAITNNLSEDVIKAINNLRKSITSTGSLNNTEISGTFNTLFGTSTTNKNANNNSTSAVSRIRKDFNSKLTNYIANLKQKPDPFLPISLGTNKTKHVSLGKILTCFLGNAYHNSFENIEMQIFFHPFNHEAARLFDYNVSQFYFAWDDFESIIKSQYSPFGKMTFGRLFRIMQQYFINDLGGPAYNFVKPNRRFARNPENLAQRGRDKEAQEAFKKNLEENKGKELKRAYYGNENDPRITSFKLPRLSINIESIPLRNTWEENGIITSDNNGPDTIIKLHIIDRTCDSNYTAAELIRSSPGRVFSKITRKNTRNNLIYRSNHEKASLETIELLKDNNFLKDLNQLFTDETVSPVTGETKFNEILNEVPEATREDIRKVLQEDYYIFDASSFAVKNLIKGIYPNLVYGTAASGILKASVSSIDDSGLATIMLLREGQGSQGSDSNENINSVPMSVMPAAVTIDTIGCPYFSYAQFYFLDFGTNTNIDNVYAVTAIDHTIEPGKFSSSIKLTWADSYAVFRPLNDSMREAALKAVLNRLGAFQQQN